MAYTALKRMREINKNKFEEYNIIGPAEVPVIDADGDLEREALLFIRDDCEDLRFEENNNEIDLWKSVIPENGDQIIQQFTGKSIEKNQIPYNMQMDNDRLTFENCIHLFMCSGTPQNAFRVYYCYIEMFLRCYNESKKMVEKLSEFESNAGPLLMKHRDHYSHSVYVFVIGLAVYRTNRVFREKYQKFYGITNDRKSAYHFLKFWGLTSLFHDIGYPFELSYEQIKCYFETESTSQYPYVIYNKIQEYISLLETDDISERYKELVNQQFTPNTLNEIFAFHLSEKLKNKYSESERYKKYLEQNRSSNYYDYLKEMLDNKAIKPEEFNHSMDHAYFSAIILFKELLKSELLGLEEVIQNQGYIDALTAILLHNSIYKYFVTDVSDNNTEYNMKHRFSIDTHPLAYLLMLCDELQCWDRRSYGQNTRSDIYPIWCNMSFDSNKSEIIVGYKFEKQFLHTVNAKDKKRKMETFQNEVIKNIESILLINAEDTLHLRILDSEFIEGNHSENMFISDSNFIHLYNFAVALNSQYNARENNQFRAISVEEMEMEFDKLSLEYQISNISQANAFAMYLDRIGCFYTDRPVYYPLKTEFSNKEMSQIGNWEHTRWLEEKKSMAWLYGSEKEQKEIAKKYQIQFNAQKQKYNEKIVRECTKTHKDIIEYEELSQNEKRKDTDPMNDMMRLIEEYDGLRVYELWNHKI